MMRRALRWGLPWATVAATVLAGACGGDDGPPGQPPPATASTGTGMGGAGQGGGTTGSGAAIPDGNCTDLSADGVELYPASEGVLLDELHRVGSRWTAVGRSGFVSFEDAPSATLPPPSVLTEGPHTAASDGTELSLVASGAQALLFQRFDGNGEAITLPAGVEVDAAVDASVSVSNVGSTIVWAFNTKLRTRTLDPMGAWANDTTDAILGAYGAGVTLATAGDGDVTALLWSGDPMGTGKVTNAQIFDGLTEITTPANTIYNSAMGHDLAGVVRTVDGWVALLTLDGSTRRPALFTLNPEGQPFGPTRDIQNGIYAHDLATDGSSFAVVSGRRDESDIAIELQPMLRIFDADLEPVGPPICLGANFELTAESAVAADGDGGYATIYTTADGAVMFHRFSPGDLGL